MAKHLGKLVITGLQVVGRAFAKALQQEIAASQAAAARAGGGVKGAQHSATNQKLGVTLEEAKQILNLDVLDPNKIQENYDYLFSINEKSKGGSFYLQSKIGIVNSIQTIAQHPKSSFGQPLLQLMPSLLLQRYYSTIGNIFSPQNVLNESNRQRCSQLLSHGPSFRKATKNPSEMASVLIPICEVQGHVCLLYTVRSAKLRAHRGEVSFPGGKCDPLDASPIHTAFREAHEEIGIDPTSIELWGSTRSYPGKDGKSAVIGVLAYIGHINYKELQVNKDEVEYVFAVSLENLCNKSHTNHTQFRSKNFVNGFVTPVFTGSEPRIWGLTALFTHSVLLALLPDDYVHSMPFVNALY